MNFGPALEALKEGARIARAGWKGKGMWLVYIHGGDYETLVDGEFVSFKRMPCIGMKTAVGNIQPGWLASQEDMLSADWEILG